jgi:hypothetical protein
MQAGADSCSVHSAAASYTVAGTRAIQQLLMMEQQRVGAEAAALGRTKSHDPSRGDALHPGAQPPAHPHSSAPRPVPHSGAGPASLHHLGAQPPDAKLPSEVRELLAARQCLGAGISGASLGAGLGASLGASLGSAHGGSHGAAPRASAPASQARGLGYAARLASRPPIGAMQPRASGATLLRRGAGPAARA